MFGRIYINRELTPEENEIISKNCYKKIIIKIHFKNEKSNVNFIIKEKRHILNYFETVENTEETASDSIQIDSKCPLSMKWKHYALFNLNDIDKNTISFDILLKSDDETLDGFKISIKEFHDDKGEIQDWYTLCGCETYSFSGIFNIGTFARITDGWKFYPKMISHSLK